MILTRRRVVATSLTALVVLVLILTSGAIPAVRDSVDVCERTGSVRHRITWFRLLTTTSCVPSPLERYIRSSQPATEIMHRWILIGATERGVLGITALYEDTFRPAWMVDECVRSAAFAELPAEEKDKLLRLLEFASERLSDEDKKNLYTELLESVDRKDVDRLVSRYGADGGRK
jgi:hypothetical protein